MAAAIATGINNPEDLKGHQWLQYGLWNQQLMYGAQATYFLWQEGTLPESVFRKEIQRATAILGHPAGRQWWDAGAKTQFAEEFVALVKENANEPSDYRVYTFTDGRGFHPLGE